MSELIGGVIGLAVRSVMIGWLAAALFWGLVGAAIAAWGRLPVAVGALVGGLLPVVGAAGLAVVAGARRSGDLTAGIAPPHVSTLPGAESAPAWQQPNGWSPQGGWQQQPWPAAGAPGTPTAPGTGWGGAPAAGGWAQQPAPGWTGQPAVGQWPAQPGAGASPAGYGQPIPAGAPARTRSPALPQPLLLGGLGLVMVAFAVGLVLTWVSVPGADDYGAFDLPMGFLLIFTELVLGLAAWLSLHLARRWVAILVAWFSSWWLVIGLAALTATDRFTDLLARVSSAPTTTGAELGPAPYLIFVAALLGLAWSAGCLALAPAPAR